MRRFAVLAFALVALAALAAPPAAAQEGAATVSAASADVLAHLERTRGLFLASIDGLTAAQWSWKPAPDRWSVAECAEHITRSESFIRELARKSMSEPLPAEKLALAHGKSAQVLAMIVDRSQKAQAPEPLNPMKSGEMRSYAEILRDFNFERGRTAELAAASGDLEAFATPHFVFQELDLAGWIYFLSGHSERHTLQIEEVKATAGFPQG
jgi:hypothetical protein